MPLLSTDKATMPRSCIAAIRIGRFAQHGVLIENGHAWPDTPERLRLVSRFPAGLTPDIRARLLAAFGQTAPDAAP